MHEYPMPTEALAQHNRKPFHRSMAALQANKSEALLGPRQQDARTSAPIELRWATTIEDIRATQRLRYQVFALEMGARLSTPVPGHDIDPYDSHCEHLMAVHSPSNRVVGAYRLMTPAQAKRLGSTYADEEFDLRPLAPILGHTAELGRACVHPDFRQGPVILALWGGVIRFLEANQLAAALGCVSIPMVHQGLISGYLASSVWRQMQMAHLAPPHLRVAPRLPLPVDSWSGEEQLVGEDCEAPPLLKGYLRLGAKVLGPPAWDPVFNTADLPVLLQTKDLPARYRERFLRN
jgi:putative hemolysin